MWFFNTRNIEKLDTKSVFFGFLKETRCTDVEGDKYCGEKSQETNSAYLQACFLASHSSGDVLMETTKQARRDAELTLFSPKQRYARCFSTTVSIRRILTLFLPWCTLHEVKVMYWIEHSIQAPFTLIHLCKEIGFAPLSALHSY